MVRNMFYFRSCPVCKKHFHSSYTYYIICPFCSYKFKVMTKRNDQGHEKLNCIDHQTTKLPGKQPENTPVI